MLLGVLQPWWHLSCPSPAPLLGLGLVPALELIQRSHAGLTSMGGSQEKGLHLHWSDHLNRVFVCMQICVDPGPLWLLFLAAERLVISLQSVALEQDAEEQ